MTITPSRVLLTGLLAMAAALSACNKTERPAYALTSTGKIIGFDTGKPTKIKTEVSVTGLATNESLVQLSYRPSNDTFYCMTNQTRICTLNPKTGAAVLVATNSFTTESLSGPVIDFNPVSDLIRVVAAEQNLRVRPNDGTLSSTDTDLLFDSGDDNNDRNPQIVGLAYDRSEQGSNATTLFALDSATQSLLRVGSKNGSPDSPNDGKLFTIAKLKIDAPFTVNAGFDIEPEGDTAYAALSASGAAAVLYRIDLSSGNADRVDVIGKGDRTILSLVVGLKEKTNN